MTPVSIKKSGNLFSTSIVTRGSSGEMMTGLLGLRESLGPFSLGHYQPIQASGGQFVALSLQETL